MNNTPQSFVDVMALWPAETFSEDAGVTPGLAAVWKHRNTIPPTYWDRLVSKAPLRNIKGISLDLLLSIYRLKKRAKGTKRAA